MVQIHPDPPILNKRLVLTYILGGHSSAGRAPALHAGGREFDPPWLHQTFPAGAEISIYRKMFPEISFYRFFKWFLRNLFFYNLDSQGANRTKVLLAKYWVYSIKIYTIQYRKIKQTNLVHTYDLRQFGVIWSSE